MEMNVKKRYWQGSLILLELRGWKAILYFLVRIDVDVIVNDYSYNYKLPRNRFVLLMLLSTWIIILIIYTLCILLDVIYLNQF